MKLFYSPGACSLAIHIALEEVGSPYEVSRVSKEAGGREALLKANPKGAVPTLVLDNGQVLTETAALLQYLADQAPTKNLLPPNGTWERYRAIEALNYVATELHKGFGPLFRADRMVSSPEGREQLKASAKEALAEKMRFVADKVGEKYFLGADYSLVDAYACTVLQWSRMVGVDLAAWPQLKAYVARVAQRPAVRRALQAEALGWN